MTAQIHEELVFEGEATSMAFCPPLPEGHPRLIPVSDIDAMRQEDSSWLFSTACWRRYQGSWEIRDGRFYLARLRGRLRLEGEEPLFADWFTGVLRIPRGEMLHYVHMGFGTVYEREVHVKVEGGVVVETREIGNRDRPIDPGELGWRNLPGGENRFPGDDAL